MARRTKDEAEKTRADLIKAAANVFYKQGVARTTLDEIARAAGVTRGAVYWHFKDKIELYIAMIEEIFLPQEEIIRALVEKNGTHPLHDLRDSCCQSLVGIARDKKRQRVISIMMHKCEYVEDMAVIIKRRQACKSRMMAQSQAMFEKAKERGHLSSHWSPELATLCLHSLMHGLISSALEKRVGLKLERDGPAALTAFFTSLEV